MSFMFNPYPYDDPNAVNRPELSEEIVRSIVSGTQEAAGYISNLLVDRLEKNRGTNVVLALDGYISARWDQAIDLVSRNLQKQSIHLITVDFAGAFKSSGQLDRELAAYLEEDREKDPVLLFGKLFKKGYEALLDGQKLASIKKKIEDGKKRTDGSGQAIIVYGCGCTITALRPLYDLICYFDVTPKQMVLRAMNGAWKNLGDQTARPFKALLRRFYYVDFEVAAQLRWDLINKDAIDLYIESDDPDHLKLIPRESFHAIMSALVKYPLRCKPVYIEGVWGGYYIKRLRDLPEEMLNCSWSFDMIPLEVSVVVEAGKHKLEFPFFTFVQKEGIALMGEDCVNRFGGYFPIRFNYDDSYHSSGNMSIQVHPDQEYITENFNEHGSQDESYYVVATGHGARTFLGFNENIDVDEFIREVKKSEKEFTPVDYEKYVNHIKSQPGVQVLLPAGTIHSSGRNQVVLEIGSLTVGSYTFKMYDYLRNDLNGVPRPIHTWHGERVLRRERTAPWVRENLVQEPQLVRKGNGWAEYIVGEHELIYFSLRRLEFEKEIEDDTNGRFHVLNLVDGEKVVVQSLDHLELSYTQNYLDIVIVPANMGKYTVKNLGNQPVCVHKTMLKQE
jgi:mannose-6-phosphate isomerase